MTAHAATFVRTDLPGPHVGTERIPGHWLLARLGKRVLRPGGMATTRWLLEHGGLGPNDDVVEFAPGMGVTAALALGRRPRSYTAIERDPAAARVVGEVLQRHAWSSTAAELIVGDATAAPLEGERATFVIGEAMLSMQSQAAKERIVAEAARVLRAGGRYAIHELALADEEPADLAAEVQRDLSRVIHVGVRIHSRAGWVDLLERHGFQVEDSKTGPVRLLEPSQLLRDEGLRGLLRFCGRALSDPTARARVRAMRAVFRKHARHLAFIAIVAKREEEWQLVDERVEDRDGGPWIAGRCSSCHETTAMRFVAGEAPAIGRCVNGHRLRIGALRRARARS